MFLDTTSISDSTLSSSAQTTTATPSIETKSGVQIGNNCNTPPSEPKQLARNDTTDSEEESSSISCRRSRRATYYTVIQNILVESLARVKTWLSASVGAAFWATLSFINHFIESQLIPVLLPLLSSNDDPPAASANNTSQHCQLAWRETSNTTTYHTPADNHHPEEQTRALVSGVEADANESSYLSAVERARKWSEETELVLGGCGGCGGDGGDYGHNISNIYGANISHCCCCHGSSLLLYNSENHIHCIDMSSQRESEHRGRFAQRANSEYNNNNHTPASVRLLSTPLALPLHGSGGPMQTSAYLHTDALQIHRHAASPFAAAHRGPTPTNNLQATHSGGGDSNNSNDKEEVRRGPVLCGAGGVQQQATDFQGQRHQACCSLGACSQSTTHNSGTHIAQRERQYNKGPHKQQGQREHEPRELLGPLRALFGMQNTHRHDNDREQDTNSSSAASGSRQQECNQQHVVCTGKRGNHQDDNHQQQHERSESPLVLVSKSTLSDLTKQIAFSMNKMKDLEEKVRVIPELERRLHNVISDTDSRSSSIGIRDSKYSVDNYPANKTSGQSSSTSTNNNYYPLRRSSLNESSPSSNIPYSRTMFSSSLRQPYGGSMRYTPGHRNGLALHSSQQPQQSGPGDSLARASSFSISSPHSNGQRYFDKLVRGVSNRNNNNNSNNGNSRQSLDHMSNALRSTQDSLNSGNSALSTKVEYEELINDLISLSYSVNYLPTFGSGNHSAAQSESSSGCTDGEGGATSGAAAGSPGAGSRSLQVGEKHGNTGNRLEPHDVIRAASAAAAGSSASKSEQRVQQQQSNQQQHSSNSKQQHVISNQPSTYHQHLLGNFNQNSLFNSNNHSSMSHLCQQQQQHHHHATKDHHHSNSYLRNHHNGSGALSLQTTPVKTQLDCGCQSFKEHLRYNSISREQRLAASTKSSQQVISSNTSSNNVSPQPQSNQHLQQPMVSSRADASTNTDLSMEDVLTKSELSKLVEEFRKSTKISPSASLSLDSEQTHNNNNNNTDSVTRNISSSPMSDSSSGSATGPNSSSQPESRSTSSGDDRMDGDEDEGVSDDNVGMKTNSSASAKDISDDEDGDLKEGSSSSAELMSQEEDGLPTGNGNEQQGKPEEQEDDDDDDDEIEVNLNSIEGAEEAYSLGSSYQDPSDFEEYCAYGESLDRRTKDFLSQTTKIPNDLRFALIRLNDAIKKDQPFAHIESSTNCIDTIRKEWFDVAANKDAQAIKTKLYVDFFESFTKQLLNIVVNLTDSAGNTAMHYAASHFKLDIIEVLLDTKVCDVNCRNKAGYTPMMLLALADLEDPYDQGVARHLFSMGDVNIKARSSGQTALMLAASHGRVSTCKLLLECGADPSQQDYDGSTALMYGSEIGNEDVVRCLLAHKLTDPNATDNDGLDALTIAMNNGHKGIGLILYAAKNVPGRMTTRHHSSTNSRLSNSTSNYLGASLRRSRGKSVTNHVRRADSLLGSRHARSVRQFAVNNV